MWVVQRGLGGCACWAFFFLLCLLFFGRGMDRLGERAFYRGSVRWGRCAEEGGLVTIN